MNRPANTTIPRPIPMLLAVIGLAATLRMAIVVVPPILDHLERGIGFGRQPTSILTMLPPVVFCAGALGGGWVMERLGLQRTAAVGMGLAALGQLARSVVSDPTLFLACTAIALFGLGLGNVAAPPLVKFYFPHRLGLVTGLYVVAIQVGAALASQLTVPMADGMGWRADMVVWGLVCVLAAVPWVVESRGQSGGVPNRLSHGPGIPFARLIRSPIAIALLVMFAAQSCLAYVILGWLPSMLADAGVPPLHTGTALALFALFQIPMSLFAPALLTRMRRPHLLIVAFAVAYLIAFVGLLLVPAQGWALWSALLGLGSGPFPAALALLGLRTRTPEAAGSLSSFVQGGGYLLAFPGPALAGAARTQSGSWTPVLVAMTVLLVPSLVSGWLAARPGYVE